MAKKEEGEEKRESKVQKLKDAFKKRKTYTEEELIELTGYDAKNLHVAIAFLKNPKRTRVEDLITLEFNKEKRTYTKKVT
jgi:hypothetical protein